jgi:uncharacterized oxidoreductase
MNVSGNSIFITGGGSGIGLALARAFLAEGNRVVIGGRDEGKLERAQRDHPGLETIVCDVTSEADVRRAAAQLADTTILVNNAGIAHVHNLRTGEWSLAAGEDEIATNLTGTIRVTNFFLPNLLRQQEAAIVNVSSALASVPLPSMPVYSAKKAAVHAYTTALRHQLEGTNVNVFDLLPTYVDTELSQDLTTDKLTSDVVALAVVNGMRKDTWQIHTGRAKTLSRINRLSPSLAQRIVTKSIRPAPSASDRAAAHP